MNDSRTEDSVPMAIHGTRFWLLASVVCLVWIPVLLAAKSGFTIHSAQTTLKDGVYYVNADAQLNFSDESLEALANGVALTVRIEMQVLRARRFWLDAKVADLSADYRIELHALSDQYVVRNLNLGTSTSYSSLDRARAALGTISDFPLIDRHLLGDDGHYVVRIRARLNIEALPAPLRPLAYISSLWRHDSDWSRWPITQ